MTFKVKDFGRKDYIELYDLNNDESETNDLSDEHPEIIARITEIFQSSRNQAPAFPYGGIVLDHISMHRSTN